MVDCSKPEGESVNNFTNEVAVKFSYNGIDDITEIMERGDYLSTIDIKDAYMAICIHPRDWERQGLRWNFDSDSDTGDTYMKDNRLCLGLSSSHYVFSKISDICCLLRNP